MNIYVCAGAEERVTLVQPMMRRLRDAGFRITQDWASDENWQGGDSRMTGEERRHHAVADLRGVEGSQVVWLMTPAYRGGRGAYVEFGYALALRALGRVQVVVASGANWRNSCFAELADFKFDEHEAAFEGLVRLKTDMGGL